MKQKNAPRYWDWIKKRKQKHSPETSYKFICAHFKHYGIDINSMENISYVLGDIYCHIFDITMEIRKEMKARGKTKKKDLFQKHEKAYKEMSKKSLGKHIKEEESLMKKKKKK